VAHRSPSDAGQQPPQNLAANKCAHTDIASLGPPKPPKRAKVGIGADALHAVRWGSATDLFGCRHAPPTQARPPRIPPPRVPQATPCRQSHTRYSSEYYAGLERGSGVFVTAVVEIPPALRHCHPPYPTPHIEPLCEATARPTRSVERNARGSGLMHARGTCMRRMPDFAFDPLAIFPRLTGTSAWNLARKAVVVVWFRN
jgi:hypothetical protein